MQAARLSLATSAFLHAIFSFLRSDFVVIIAVGNRHLTTKVMMCGLVVVNSESELKIFEFKLILVNVDMRRKYAEVQQNMQLYFCPSCVHFVPWFLFYCPSLS